MIPTTQTTFYSEEDKSRGNCLNAVLASLLHIPIEHIPEFPYDKTYVQVMNEWLKQFGLAFILIGTFDEHCESEHIEGCHHMLAGKTKRFRDISHGVVGIDGHMVFDVHPSRDGLTEVTHAGVFISLEPWKTVATTQIGRKLQVINPNAKWGDSVFQS
jgi:hypothetical protein